MKNNNPDALPGRRVGLVSIVGRANVGKSTLLNTLLQEKVSIVSPVAQTTRNLIRGVITDERGQLVFLDTPGVHKARYDLGRLMNHTARTATKGVDVALLVLDVSTKPRLEDNGWMQRLATQKTPLVFALNKSDLMANEGRTGCEAEYREAWLQVAEACPKAPDPMWILISAASNKGVQELETLLFSLMPEGPLLFAEDMLSDYPRKLAMADVVREKFFLALRDELPHCIAVCIENIHEKSGTWLITGDVYVNKESQKGIVIGRKGAMLGAARRQAEQELSEIYESPVRLELRVRVKPDWARDKSLLRKCGYLSD